MDELDNRSMGSVSRSPLQSHSHSASDDLKEKLIKDNDKTNIVINEIDNDSSMPSSSSYSYTLLIKLCLLGFFVNFQPSESYLSSYLEDTKGFTDSQIDNNVWPYDTYGALISLLPIGIAAEHFGFRKIIFFGLICREGTRLILLFGTELWQMSIMQLLYASAISVNWVYYAYIYMVIIDESKYQITTSWVQSSMLLGTFLSSILAQLLVSYTNLANNYVSLFYLSWISTTFALLSFFVLPKPNRSSPISVFKIIINNGWKVLFGYIKSMYFEKSGIVILWSLWWIGGYGSYSIYSNYYQNQFIDYNKNGGDGYYGFVNAILELCSIFGSLIPVIYAWRYNKHKNTENETNIWVKYSYLIVLTSCIMMAATIGISIIFQNLYISYICNSIMFGIYHFQLAVACSCIAFAIGKDKDENNDENSDEHHYYAMVFTFNSFLGLIIASIAQSIGSAMEWNTNMYYWCCVLFHVLTIIVLLLNKYCVNNTSNIHLQNK